MVQSKKYYKSRAVVVASEVCLNTDRDLADPPAKETRRYTSNYTTQEVLHFPQSARTGAWPSASIFCQTQDTRWEGLTSPERGSRHIGSADKSKFKKVWRRQSWFSKSNLQEMVGWLVGFNGISTSIGYLMPKPVYTYYMYGLLTHKLMIPY